MKLLATDQQARAITLLKTYSSIQNVTEDATLDANRVQLIETTLKPLVSAYLGDTLPLAEFKSRNDGINKRNEYWGFKGMKGQMFFNMVTNVSPSLEEWDSELKAAIVVPTNEETARSRIRTLISYVKRISEQHLEAGGTKHECPRLGSVPYFLSFFWQIQARDVWPVYYTSSVRSLEHWNLWQTTDDPAEDYVAYKHIHEELAELYSKETGKPYTLYDVEHVFWGDKGVEVGKQSVKTDSGITKSSPAAPVGPAKPVFDRLPDSYVPPIVAVLPQMSLNDPKLAEAAKASGSSIERTFEKNIHAAFTILGFDTKLLGQGQGRVPDGQALDMDNSYGLLWDGKVRTSGYSMGTDDRTIREYITSQSRELRRRRSLRNIYYVIVSSSFTDDFDDSIRMLKMETDISEVSLLEADALVALVDVKLRNPQQVTLGPDGIQRLFSRSGIVTAEDVREALEE